LKIITWTKRLLLTLTILALIATNFFTLTSTAFNAAISGLVGTALAIRTVSSMMQSKITSQDKAIKKHQSTAIKRKAAIRKFSTRLASRIKRVAAKSIAAIPAESIPFIGVAVLIADTGYAGGYCRCLGGICYVPARLGAARRFMCLLVCAAFWQLPVYGAPPGAKPGSEYGVRECCRYRSM
jgi:hypothetical protein